jgi:hypothetical protein
MARVAKANVTFYENATQTGTGLEFSVSQDMEYMNLEVGIEAGTTFNLQVEVQVLSNTWKPHYAIQMPAVEIITDITNPTYYYKVNLEGFTKVRIKITSITGKITYVYGKVMGN